MMVVNVVVTLFKLAISNSSKKSIQRNGPRVNNCPDFTHKLYAQTLVVGLLACSHFLEGSVKFCISLVSGTQRERL